MFAPAIWLIDQFRTGEFGPVPMGGLTYWSGLWATALLLLALAITPAVTIPRFAAHIVPRTIGGTRRPHHRPSRHLFRTDYGTHAHRP
jgi:DMSO/TMAO reductase YedYZ heme-binding membrane subunit